MPNAITSVVTGALVLLPGLRNRFDAIGTVLIHSQRWPVGRSVKREDVQGGLPCTPDVAATIPKPIRFCCI